MSSYNETDPVPKDLDLSTPTEGATTPAEINNAIREAKRVLKVGSAIITTTGNLQLTEQHSTVLINGAHTVTLPTIADVSSSTFTRRYRLINISASTGVLKTKAAGETLNGSNYASTGLDLPAQYKEYLIYGNGTVWYMESVVVLADTISELTAAAGVTVDGVLLKDSEVTTDTINEKTGAAGVTIDGFKIKDNAPAPTSWPSFSASKSSTQTVSAVASTKVTFNTEAFDTNSDFASNRFTPTVAGKYLIHSNLRIENFDSGFLIMSLNKNGSVIIREKDDTAIAIRRLSITAIVDMNGSTDYLEIFVDSETDSSYQVTDPLQQSRFAGSRIA